ncbi:MAG: hypothetical protein L6M37_01015 [Candidatus Methylarchaceae archaeon HK02M1]|nr:hypothetical protein [Candidatus Methylarchaceae archaeon HK01M]MCP8311519.1 hypothetical protein [Candidatus Methylarchaceae archaeon HK02M1]
MMLPSSDVKKDIFERYNRKPKGWHVLVRRDQRGHYDTIFLHGKDVWFIKEEPVKPYELVGFGIADKVDDEDALSSIKPYQFGFRPIPKKHIAETIKAFRDRRKIESVISKIMTIKPVPFDEITSKLAVQGPILYPNNPINLLSNQDEIDLKLRSELEKLLYRKYPYLLTTYL